MKRPLSNQSKDPAPPKMVKADHFYDTSGWVYRHTKMFNLRHDLPAPIIDAPIEIEPIFPPPPPPAKVDRPPLGDIITAQNTTENPAEHKCAWTACTLSFRTDFDLWVHTKAHWAVFPSINNRICKWEACWLLHEGKKNYHSHCSKYLCIRQCGKLFASKKEGEDHMMLHTEAKAFVFGCQVGRCLVRFRTVGALGRHVLTEHGRPSPSAAGESDKEN